MSRSVILAPFNSLEQDQSAAQENARGLILPKKVIKFRSKLRELNRRYERDNNSKLDNGVYVQSAVSVAIKKGDEKASRARISHLSNIVGTSEHDHGVDRGILKSMETMGFDKSFVLASLDHNELNSATTLYYLLAEK